jgi:hypothetical protein
MLGGLAPLYIKHSYPLLCSTFERPGQPQRQSLVYVNPKASAKDFHPSKNKEVEGQDQQSGGLLDPMDKVEVADEFDDEPLIEDVPEDEESLNKLYKIFRESFIRRESSRLPLDEK